MKKILLVDDNIENLELLKIVFELANFETIGINNSKSIDATISSFNPDLILMDIMLGQTNGMDVCNELKKSPKTNHIPIMLMSASNLFTKEKEAACLADSYIPKPFDIDELVVKANELLLINK